MWNKHVIFFKYHFLLFFFFFSNILYKMAEFSPLFFKSVVQDHFSKDVKFHLFFLFCNSALVYFYLTQKQFFTHPVFCVRVIIFLLLLQPLGMALRPPVMSRIQRNRTPPQWKQHNCATWRRKVIRWQPVRRKLRNYSLAPPHSGCHSMIMT